MVGLFKRKQKIKELAMKTGVIDLVNNTEDRVSVGLRMLLLIALDISNKNSGLTLEKIESFDFDVLGARWVAEGGLVSISLYLEEFEGVIKVQSGVMGTQYETAVLLSQEHLIASINRLTEDDKLCRVRWEP